MTYRASEAKGMNTYLIKLFLSEKFGEEYTTFLADIINDIEQAKLDHEERLRKLEGNDI